MDIYLDLHEFIFSKVQTPRIFQKLAQQRI